VAAACPGAAPDPAGSTQVLAVGTEHAGAVSAAARQVQAGSQANEMNETRHTASVPLQSPGERTTNQIGGQQSMP